MLWTNQSSLARLAEEPEPDVPEGTLASLAQTNRPQPEQSTTTTPTTTGTVGGYFYSLAPDQPKADDPYRQAKLDETLQRNIDLAGGFASPIMKVEQLGMEQALQGLRGAERSQQRGILRRLLRAANRKPTEGPQGLRERADVIKGAAGLKSKARDEAEEYIDRNIREIQQALDDPTYTPETLRDVVEKPYEMMAGKRVYTGSYENALAKRRWNAVKNIDFMDWLRTRAAVERVKHPLESVKK